MSLASANHIRSFDLCLFQPWTSKTTYIADFCWEKTLKLREDGEHLQHAFQHFHIDLDLDSDSLGHTRKYAHYIGFLPYWKVDRCPKLKSVAGFNRFSSIIVLYLDGQSSHQLLLDYLFLPKKD